MPARVTAGVVIVGECDTSRRLEDRFHGLRQTEVQHLDRAVGPHLDVRGFQVAMDDSQPVRRFESLCDLSGNRQCFIERNGATRDALRQVFARHELHGEGMDAAGLLEPVDLRDVLMVERRKGLRFAPEAGDAVRVGRERLGQDLDRDIAVEPRVSRPVDLPHPAGAEGREDFIRTQACASGECQSS